MRSVHVALRGGLELVQPRLARSRGSPGAAVVLTNYVSAEDGYRRVGGYTRWDGRTGGTPRASGVQYARRISGGFTLPGAWVIAGRLSASAPTTFLTSWSQLAQYDEAGYDAGAALRLRFNNVTSDAVSRDTFYARLRPEDTISFRYEDPTTFNPVQVSEFVFRIKVAGASSNTHIYDGFLETRSPRGSLPPLEDDVSLPAEHFVVTFGFNLEAQAGAVPGAGPILGLFRYQDFTYALRRSDAPAVGAEDEEDVPVDLWRAEVRGWTRVPPADALAVRGAGGGLPARGDLVTGQTSMIQREVLHARVVSGDLANDDAEVLVYVRPVEGSVLPPGETMETDANPFAYDKTLAFRAFGGTVSPHDAGAHDLVLSRYVADVASVTQDGDWTLQTEDGSTWAVDTTDPAKSRLTLWTDSEEGQRLVSDFGDFFQYVRVSGIDDPTNWCDYETVANSATLSQSGAKVSVLLSAVINSEGDRTFATPGAVGAVVVGLSSGAPLIPISTWYDNVVTPTFSSADRALVEDRFAGGVKIDRFTWRPWDSSFRMVFRPQAFTAREDALAFARRLSAWALWVFPVGAATGVKLPFVDSAFQLSNDSRIVTYTWGNLTGAQLVLLSFLEGPAAMVGTPTRARMVMAPIDFSEVKVKRTQGEFSGTLSSQASSRIVASGPDVVKPRLRSTRGNFSARAEGERLYFVTGGGSCHEFDGNDLVPISTGLEELGRFPTHVAVHRQHLFLAYPGGSVLWSNLGDPHGYDAATGGAGELGVGDEVTGIVGGYRQVLFILSRNLVNILKGTSSADFVLEAISNEAGALADTAQIMDQLIAYDDRGMRSVAATEAFGDFAVGTLTHRIFPLVERWKRAGLAPTASVRLRRLSQYRLYFPDGDVLVASYVQRRDGFVVEFSTLRLPSGVGHVVSEEDADGRERVFFAFDDEAFPFVYESEVGDDFDGEPVHAVMRLPYNDLGSPEVLKSFRKLTVDGLAERPAPLLLSVEYDDGVKRMDGVGPRTFEMYSAGSVWSDSYWDQFEWDRVASPRVGVRLSGGRGRSFAAIVVAPVGGAQPHTLSGVTMQFLPRKVIR